jgi:hypothetical protein
MKERDRLEDLDLDGSKILIRILREQDGIALNAE